MVAPQEATMTTRKLAVLNIGAHGHVNPTLPVVADLVRRGVEVTYFATAGFEGAVQATGARFVAYDSPFINNAPTEAKNARLAPADLVARFPLRLIGEAEHVLPQLLRHLEADRPDALIYDNMCLAGRLAAEHLSLPAMTFRPSYAANEHFSLGRAFGEVSEEHPARVEFRAVAKRVAERYGVTELVARDPFSHAEALNVVFMPRAFQPAGDTFDERFLFVGPAIPAGAPLRQRQDSPPVLLISLGTVFNEWPEFFNMTFDAFGSSSWHVVAAVGNRIDPKTLKSVPDNFSVHPHVAQLDALSRATAFVTHGGMNSTQEGLWYGVPLVVIPQMHEQAQTARRVQELQLGRAFLDRAHVTVDSLREAVADVVHNPLYTQNIARIRQADEAAGGAPRAAEAIERFLG
jgi:MGT family glycosyltransferase